MLWNLSFLLLAGVLMSLQAAPIETAQQHPAEYPKGTIQLEDPTPPRDSWQQPDRVVEMLELKSGDVVADLGAGSGYFTLRLARAVAPNGKVYAVDIDRQMLGHVERRAKEEGLLNIQTILAEPHDPKLPASSLDLIFICDTLHHIPNRAAYYPLLARALKPDGRLANIDFEKRPLPHGPPMDELLAKEEVVKELELAGFRLVNEFPFLKYQYFLVFQR
jgi:ubiquinone/menaquinone biosynthesis C-methylase UbiE